MQLFYLFVYVSIGDSRKIPQRKRSPIARQDEISCPPGVDHEPICYYNKVSFWVKTIVKDITVFNSPLRILWLHVRDGCKNLFLNMSKSGKCKNLSMQECLKRIYRSLNISVNHFQLVIFIEGTFDFMDFYSVECSHKNKLCLMLWGHEMSRKRRVWSWRC